jgi:hypothetical protein
MGVVTEFVGAGIAVVVVVTMFAFVTVVVVGVSVAIGVAVSGFFETGSSSELREAPSHFTQKCKTRVVHEVTAAGVFFFEIFVPVFGVKI